MWWSGRRLWRVILGFAAPLAVLPASLESVEPKVVQSDRDGVTVEIAFPEPTTALIYHDGAVWGVLRIPGLGPWDGIG
jgi:hypothetical protein